MTDRLLTTQNVAARFITGPPTVRYGRHIGIGPAGLRLGRRLLHDEQGCDRWYRPRCPSRARADVEALPPPARPPRVAESPVLRTDPPARVAAVQGFQARSS
jgi:hypothetical protein